MRRISKIYPKYRLLYALGAQPVLSQMSSRTKGAPMKKRLAIAAVALSGLVLMSSALPASADTNSKDLAELVDMSPGLSVTELKSSLTAYAKENGLTLDEATDMALAEGRKSVAAAAPIASASSPQARAGAPARTITLGAARYRGDVFVTPASTSIVPHGHTGIYYTTTTIVEAPGKDMKSRSISASSVKVAKGAVKQYVRTTSSVAKTNAANYAYKNYRGLGYNMNFAINKSIKGKDMNCSQLVWAAYKATNGFDLDGNGGLGVYPFNIKDSNLTTTYATL